jgi:hypothetical protein
MTLAISVVVTVVHAVLTNVVAVEHGSYLATASFSFVILRDSGVVWSTSCANIEKNGYYRLVDTSTTIGMFLVGCVRVVGIAEPERTGRK